jgi:hypothetical protein
MAGWLEAAECHRRLAGSVGSLASASQLPSLLPCLRGVAPRVSLGGGVCAQPGLVGKLTCKLAVALQLRAVVDERRVSGGRPLQRRLWRWATGCAGAPRDRHSGLCGAACPRKTVVPALWRLPLLKEPIWRLWVVLTSRLRWVCRSPRATGSAVRRTGRRRRRGVRTAFGGVRRRWWWLLPFLLLCAARCGCSLHLGCGPVVGVVAT